MNWSGGGTISHTVTPAVNVTYTANFRTQYYLTMGHGPGGTVTPPVVGKTVEQLFRLRPRPPAAIASPIGLAAEQALFPERTIRLQLQWADPSQRTPLSLTIDANHVRKPCVCKQATPEATKRTV